MLRYIPILILVIGIFSVSAEGYENNTTGLGYNNTANETIHINNTVKDYEALIEGLQKNITKLHEEVKKKNKLLAEYINYKKENVKLKENITNLQKTVITLEAENEIIKQENKMYRGIVTELISRQSNETKEEYILAYREWKKDVSNFRIGIFIAVLVCIVIGYLLIKSKKRYDYPV